MWSIFVFNKHKTDIFIIDTGCKCSWCAFVIAFWPSSLVNFFYFNHISSETTDFDKTTQEWSLGDPLQKLLKEFYFALNSDCHGNQKEKL